MPMVAALGLGWALLAYASAGVCARPRHPQCRLPGGCAEVRRQAGLAREWGLRRHAGEAAHVISFGSFLQGPK